jgi:transposase
LVEAAAALRAKSTPAVTVQARPLGFVLTGGEVSDYRAFPALLDMPVAKPKALLADKGYDGDAVREDLLWRGILPIIPPKTNRREPPACDFRRYRDRNHVERLFSVLSAYASVISFSVILTTLVQQPIMQLRNRLFPNRHEPPKKLVEPVDASTAIEPA